MTTYEVKSFIDPSENVGDQTAAEDKAPQWLNEVAKKNGRVISVTTTPASITQHPGGTFSTFKSRIIIAVAYD